MTKKPTTLGFGSVSSGTMRAQDLIPSFLSEAEALHLSAAERKEVRAIRARADADGYYDNEDPDGDLESLFDVLGNHCPDYAYFGAHPGDGSDYGVWLSDEWQERMREDDVLDISNAEVPTGYTGLALSVSDHGNPTLYRVVRGKQTILWSLV